MGARTRERWVGIYHDIAAERAKSANEYLDDIRDSIEVLRSTGSVRMEVAYEIQKDVDNIDNFIDDMLKSVQAIRAIYEEHVEELSGLIELADDCIKREQYV